MQHGNLYPPSHPDRFFSAMARSEGLDEWVLVAVSLADVFGRVCPLLDFDGGPTENKAERVDRLKRSLDHHVTILTNVGRNSIYLLHDSLCVLSLHVRLFWQLVQQTESLVRLFRLFSFFLILSF